MCTLPGLVELSQIKAHSDLFRLLNDRHTVYPGSWVGLRNDDSCFLHFVEFSLHIVMNGILYPTCRVNPGLDAGIYVDVIVGLDAP